MKAFITASALSALCFAGLGPAAAAPVRDVVLVHGAFAGPSSWDKVGVSPGA